MDNGFFGMIFDLDGDGELNDFERAADLGAFVQMVEGDNDLDTDDFEWGEYNE